ncbi:MAG: SDR family oxidoreductase [Bacteroidota bacterium]
MNLGLTDQVALITGASAGLGFATAEALLREGARVALCSRDQARIEAAAASLRASVGAPDDHVLPLVCDVTDEGQIQATLAAVVDAWGGLQVLITNAGGPPAGAALAFDAPQWRRALELNLMSTVNLCRHALPRLRESAQRGQLARVVMVASISAKQPIPGLALSNTARAGVLGFMKSLAAEVGPDGVTVNAVLPGYTRTERLTDLATSIRTRTGQTVEEVEAGWAAESVLGRIADPVEFAEVVAFLASRPASYLTGLAIPVDGGASQHLL